MEERERYEEEVTIVPITVFTPHIRKQVTVLLLQRGVGLCKNQLKVMNPVPSSASIKSQVNCDRFLLVIPYAGYSLQCMVVFQSSNPDCPPDFIFSDSKFFVPVNEIEALRCWDVKKPESLLLTMKEILQIYKKRQINTLEKYEHLTFEYLCLYQLQDFNEDDIEIYVPFDRESAVVFLIKLHINFQALFPDFYKKDLDSEDEEYPLLFVTFPNRESNRSYQKLFLPKEIEKLLGLENEFKLSDDVTDHYLTRYIMALDNEIKTRSELASSRYDKRKIYFLKFLNHFKTSIVEYDEIYYTNMALLIRYDDDYFVMIEINMPEDFPLVTPALVFRSIYHTTFMNEPVANAVDSYPYSPSWSIHKVLDETAKFINEYIPIFKRDCAVYQYQFQAEKSASGAQGRGNTSSGNLT